MPRVPALEPPAATNAGTEQCLGMARNTPAKQPLLPSACSRYQQKDKRSSCLSCLVQRSSIKEPHTKVTFKTSATGRSAELTKSMLGKNTAKGKHQPQTALDSLCVTVITSFFWVFLGLLYLCPFILFILLSENAEVLLEQQFSWHRT